MPSCCRVPVSTFAPTAPRTPVNVRMRRLSRSRPVFTSTRRAAFIMAPLTILRCILISIFFSRACSSFSPSILMSRNLSAMRFHLFAFHLPADDFGEPLGELVRIGHLDMRVNQVLQYADIHQPERVHARPDG